MHSCKIAVKVSRALPRLGFRLLVFVIALGCIASCSTAAKAQRASDEELIAIGWVQAAGEIRIYLDKADLGKLYDVSCTSGVMTNGRTLPTKYRNRLVEVYGKLVDAKEFEDMLLQGTSAGVENYCNSPKIAIITRIESVRGK